jgi:hypothetical protein
MHETVIMSDRVAALTENESDGGGYDSIFDFAYCKAAFASALS